MSTNGEQDVKRLNKRRQAVVCLTAACFAAVLCAVGCSGPQVQQPDPTNNTAGTTQALVGGEQDVKTDPGTDGEGGDKAEEGGWTCENELIPPVGYLQETVFVDAGMPSAVQTAADGARLKLVGRICEGATCEGLEELASTWKTGKGAGQVCAMVVIKRAQVDQWRSKQNLGDLDAALVTAAKELTNGVKQPAVAIDKIMDGGVPGGERASWLEARMIAALQTAGATIVEIPDDWDGVGTPDGIHALIGAKLSTRKEKGDTLVEVAWEARVSKAKGKPVERKVAKPLSFHAAAAPAVASSVAGLPVSDADLSVRITSKHAGGLCAGELTHAWLSSSSDLHVRVFDLYGRDGAVMIFPNAEVPSDKIKAGQKLPLGGSGSFQVLPVPGSDIERFVVIAAKDPKDLGVVGDYKTTCRLPPAAARAMHKGEDFPPKAKVVSDGFRLLPADECTSVQRPTLDQMRELAQALESLPECK